MSDPDFSQGHVYVIYREGITLRIPFSATDLAGIFSQADYFLNRGTHYFSAGVPFNMPSNPSEIWQRLFSEAQQDILNQLALICKEIIDDIRTCHHTTPSQQSHHLRAAINTTPNINQSRKLGITIRTQKESCRTGLVT